jgi:hypothetical protein
MAYGLYCRLSRRIAAIGMVAGAILLPWDKCHATQAMPVIDTPSVFTLCSRRRCGPLFDRRWRSYLARRQTAAFLRAHDERRQCDASDVGVLWPAFIERLATGARRGPLCSVRVRAMSGLKH